MNKKKFIQYYKKDTTLNTKEATEDIEIFFELLGTILNSEKKVSFSKKGVFEVLNRLPRKISNPSTREIMEISPVKTIKFRMSKKVKF